MGSAIATIQRSGIDATTWILCWQAAVGRDFLVPASIASRIRSRLIAAHHRPGRVLIDFVLLPTEIHAIVQIDADDSVRSVARAFMNIVSRWVHDAQPVRGPVLAGPFWAQPIDSSEALRREVRMLAWRPVVRRSCATPTHHPQGALRIALGLSPPMGFNSRPLIAQFGPSVREARASLRLCIARRPTEQEWRAWELVRNLELATGSVGPQPSMARTVGAAAAALIAAGGGYGIDGGLELLELWVRAKVSPVGPPDLKSSSESCAARGRALVACLAVSHSLCSAASVARYFRRAKSTLSEQMAACRARPSDKPILSTSLHRILEESALLRAPRRN